MTRHGQIQVYGGHAPKEEFDIIDNDDYKFKLKKTWVEATSVWHIQLISQSIFDRKFECFLSHEELAKLKAAL